MASNPLSRAVHRPVKTCTQCKQVKLRCDSKDQFPAPCTRCRTRNLQCVVDSSFRRTPARKRVEEMAKELEALRSQRQDAASHSLTESPSVPGTQDSPDHSQELCGTAMLDDSDIDVDQFELEDFILDRDTVIDVFKLFCVFFYPHLPILNPTISIARLYDTSPILFWTIMAVTTQRPIVARHQHISESLREPYLQFFRSEILNAPLPLQTIQAITYLTMYPYPIRIQNKDPSWLYSGIAVNAAMYMGLHRAKTASSLQSIGVHAGSPRARAHTWLGCFLSSTALAKHVGVSAPIKGTADLATIEHMIRDYPLPAEFTYQIMVHHTLAKFFNTIVENSQENMSHSLIRIIDAELDGLKTRYPTPWTSRAELTYLTAKLLLYTTVIVRLQSDRASREILMRNGLSVAVRIAYLTDQGLGYTSPEYPDITYEALRSTLPKNFYRILVLSTAFLIRFFVLNIHAMPEEQELARNHVAIAQRYLKWGCNDPLDERVRGAVLFDVLCRQKPIDLDNSKLRVDDRLGASLLYDAITTGHVLRNKPVEVEEASPRNELRVSPKIVENAPLEQGVSGTGAEPDSQEAPVDMNDFVPMDFSLPEDLWGDSIWGMFDPIAPSGYPNYTVPEMQGNLDGQFGWSQ